jgi:hypothetical protein
MLTAALVLCGVATLGAQAADEELFVNHPRPIAMMAEKIEQRTGAVITYEDPQYEYAADIEESADTDAFGKRVFDMRTVPFVFTLDAAKRKDVVQAVRELVDAFEMRTGGQKFKVIAAKGFIHIVPQVNRNKAGTWVEQQPVLDTRISLPAGKRTLAEFMTEFTEAISSVVAQDGRRIDVGVMPLNLAFNTEVTWPEIKNREARDVLRDVLLQAPVKLSWQLYGGVGLAQQALNLHRAGSREGDK